MFSYRLTNSAYWCITDLFFLRLRSLTEFCVRFSCDTVNGATLRLTYAPQVSGRLPLCWSVLLLSLHRVAAWNKYKRRYSGGCLLSDAVRDDGYKGTKEIAKGEENKLKSMRTFEWNRYIQAALRRVIYEWNSFLGNIWKAKKIRPISPTSYINNIKAL